MEKAYRFRMYPTRRQEELIQKTFGCARFVYNYYLNKRQTIYKEAGETFGYNDCSSDMTLLKKELAWLKEPDSTALQSSLKDMDIAYQNFFRRVKKGEKPGFPRYKSKKSSRKSYKTKNINENIQVFDKHIKLPKLGKVSARISKQVQGRILNATISQSPSGKYFVSICCTSVEITQYEPTGAVVGIDLGIKDLAITSDGKIYSNPKHLRKNERKLARLQRQLSRKQIGSSNREKARVKVALLHEQIANQRLDAIHKMTTELVKGYDVICIEDLAVNNMIGNKKFAKSINDAAWGEIRRQLTYKTTWQNKALSEVNRYFPSSQLCDCGFKNSKVKDLSVRLWICPSCSKENDRDENAANNILNEGLRLLAA